MLVVVLDSRGCNTSTLCSFRERLHGVLEYVLVRYPVSLS
jgi:hypothetical protein